MSQNWIQHTLRRSRWRPQNQAAALATLGVIIALIIGVLYLSQVSSNATTGRQLADLIAERNELQSVNEQLRAEIAELRSVPRLLARASELGFVPAGQDQIEYLVIEGYNPHRDETVAPLQKEEPQLPVYDESFGGWLQQQLDNLRAQFEGFSGTGE
ncbi:MAG: hypothetical protein D6712_01400 [Chloroflexi bacterium]|nr:MAG: hypothetical protein D6712_01400 [Chloroflexota bacterium]